MRSDPALDSIAADLNSVLERLAAYLEEQPNRPAWIDDESVTLEGGADPELLAAILYRYAMGPPALRDAIAAAQAAADALERKRSALVAQHGEKKAELLTALYACELGYRFGQPVPLEDCMALAAAGRRFITKRDRYLGHDGRHRTMRNDGHLDSHGFEKRLAAAIVHTRVTEDPKNNPLTVDVNGVFQKVVDEGRFPFSAKTLANYYYEETAWPGATPSKKDPSQDRKKPRKD